MLLSAHGLEAIPAIDRFVGPRKKGHFGLTAAIRADRRIELPRTCGVSAVAAAISAISAAVISATGRVAIGLSFRPACLTSHGRREPPFCIERLLSLGEDKLLSAIAAGECLITHSARTLLPWRSTTDRKRTHATSPTNRIGESSPMGATPCPQSRLDASSISYISCNEKVNYRMQNDAFLTSQLLLSGYPEANVRARLRPGFCLRAPGVRSALLTGYSTRIIEEGCASALC